MGRVRRRLLLVVLGGALLGLVAPSQANGAGCRTPSGYTLKERSSEARIFLRKDGRKAYGCLLSTGRLVRVGVVNRYWLSGRYVAYRVYYYEGEGEALTTLFIRDLKTGQNLRREDPWVPPDFTGDPPPGQVTDLTMKRNGSLAWISCLAAANGLSCEPGEPYQVWRVDRGGGERLEHSTEVKPRSLERSDSKITWIVGDSIRSATLR